MMAHPLHGKDEGTSTAGLWLSPEDKTKASKKKCIFKNHLIDNNCTKSDCLLYPKLSCRKFTFTNNADRAIPRYEHHLNQTRCAPISDLRCNPFQTPLKEIVAQEIRLCAKERCSNYSLRYIFNNACKCDMNTLRGLLPSYRGYNNICCKRMNYNRQLANKIDADKLQMFQKTLASAVETTKRSHASDPYGIHGSFAVQTRCKSLASHQVPLSKDSSSSANTNYLFRSQLMKMAERKFEENKVLVSTETNAVAVEVEDTEVPTELDNSNIPKTTDGRLDLEEHPKENEALNTDSIPMVFDYINGADGIEYNTSPGEGLTMDNEENGGTAIHDHIMEDLELMVDELKAVSGEESEFTSDVHNFGNGNEFQFTEDLNGFRPYDDDAVEQGAEVEGNEIVSERALLQLNALNEEKVNGETTKTEAEETEGDSQIQE